MRTALLLVVMACAPSCAAFRSTWRGLHNADLRGDAAPTILATHWFAPGAASEPLEVDAATWNGRWRLLVFFLPT